MLSFKKISNFVFAVSATLTTLLITASCVEFEPQNLAAPRAIDATEPGAYIVVLSNDTGGKLQSHEVVANKLTALSDNYDLGEASKTFSQVLRGGVYELSTEQVQALRKDSRVAYVERDEKVSINQVSAFATQGSAPWGLDRLDQAALPLDRLYTSPDSASGFNATVNAYVIDTGIKIQHVDFQGRAAHGHDFVDNDEDATDCNGHGTHVAGTIAGATYGVAKLAKVVGVRVLDCAGSGSYSGVIAGIEWVTENHVKPAVANMSLGGGASQAIDDAIKASIQSGVTYVVAAGNENQNACNTSPARVPLAITVGSTTNQDVRSSFSNYGTCVDVFAPGSDILSAWYNSTTATSTISGTSMASPHVAGVAALYLAKNPQALPAEVTAKILAGASSGRLTSVGTGSPNLLLNTAFLNPTPTPVPTPVPTPPPPVEEPGVTRLQNGVSQTGKNGVKGSEQFYVVEVPAGAAKLTIEISSGGGDADLYTKFASKPTQTSYDCRPYRTGNTESCTVTAPKAGKYYVRIHAYSTYSALQVVAKY